MLLFSFGRVGLIVTFKTKKLLARFWFVDKEGIGVGCTANSLEYVIGLTKSTGTAITFNPIFDSYIEN